MSSKLLIYFTWHYKQQGKCLFYFWPFIFTLLFQEKLCCIYSMLLQLLLQATLDIFAFLAHLNNESKLMAHYMQLMWFLFLYIKPKIIFDTDCNSRMSWACWRQKAPDSVSKKPWRCWHAGCRRNKLRKTLWKSTCDGMPTDAGKANPTWHLQGSSTHYHCKHTGKDSRPEPVSRQGQQKALHCTSPQAWPAFQSTASSPLCHSGPLAGTKEEEGNNPPTTCSLWSIWCQYFEREP